MESRRTEEFIELLSQVPEERRWCTEYVQGKYMLMCSHESDGDEEKACEVAKEIINNIDLDVTDADIIRTCYDVMARNGDFEAFMIAMEWNRPMSKKFYLPRARLLKKHGLIDALQGLQDDKYDLVVLNMPPRSGKLISDDTPVLTRNGWKTHGNLGVGDYVLNDKGNFVLVEDVSPKDYAEYEVWFSNGDKIKCHGNHEWLVYDRHVGKNVVRETRYMIGKIRDCYSDDTCNHYRFLIPQKEPVKGNYNFLPVDPYTYGAWLGDGTNANPYITGPKTDEVIAQTIENNGYKIRHIWVNKVTGVLTYSFEGLRESLQCLGLSHSRRNTKKYIHSMYLTASLSQRLELLAGLLDTDGTYSKKEHRYHYSTTDETLKNDVVSLISTFGWRASVIACEPKLSTSNVQGKKVCWVISFNPTMEVPCKVPRKQNKSFSKPRRVSIIDIKPLKEKVIGNCIQVEGGIYLVGRQLIPTHNSTLSIFFLAMRAALYPELSILGNGCTTVLTDSFYKEFLNFVTSDEYRFSEIFPSINIVNKSSEYDYLDFNTEKRFHTVTFRSVDATTTGVAEASNLLYCDDLVKDVETANSKERLDKLYHTYTGTMKDRKVSRLCKDGVYRSCPELHVNTPWSIHDVTSRVIKDAEKMENDDRVKIVSVPCWDEERRSNFEYDYGKGFNTRYYEEMEVAEDPVIFSAKYLMKPIEREGRPFERDSLIYFDELPLDDKGNTKVPDRVVAYNDVSHGGNDYMSMPIAYVYGTDVYIVDVLFMRKFDGDAYSRPKVCEKIINWKIASCGFEKNNGGDFYESLIHEDLMSLGVRCHTIAFNASTRQSKLDRILSCQSDIHGDSMLNGTFRLFFRNPASLHKNSEYMAFLENLWGWSQKEGSIQKSQHDDAPDSLAGLIINMLGKRVRGGFSLYDIRDAGY